MCHQGFWGHFCFWVFGVVIRASCAPSSCASSVRSEVLRGPCLACHRMLLSDSSGDRISAPSPSEQRGLQGRFLHFTISPGPPARLTVRCVCSALERQASQRQRQPSNQNRGKSTIPPGISLGKKWLTSLGKNHCITPE